MSEKKQPQFVSFQRAVKSHSGKSVNVYGKTEDGEIVAIAVPMADWNEPAAPKAKASDAAE